MKKLFLTIAIAVAFIACNDGQPKDDKKPKDLITDTIPKIIDTTIIEDRVAPVSENVSAKKKPEKVEKVSCGFKFQKLNQHKRTTEEAPGGKKGKPCKNCPPPPPPPPPPPVTSDNVIYLNFLGKTVSNTMWNVNGAFTVDVSGLGQMEIDQVLAGVREEYKNYSVTITDDKDVFDAAAHRIEVVVTESWEWYGQAGGVAYINSWTWNDGSPAFVFSSLLGYNVKNILEACSHEAGHTLGLRHQSDCTNGVNTNEYSNGKIMGVSYYTFPYGYWYHGTNSLCVDQDDNVKIISVLGSKN